MATLPDSSRNAMVNALVDLIDGGAGAGNLIFQTSGDVEVATCPFSNPAFGNAASGTATANAITDETNATGGTTTKASLQDGSAVEIIEATVATSGADINLSSTTIGAGDTVSITSLTVTQPAS